MDLFDRDPTVTQRDPGHGHPTVTPCPPLKGHGPGHSRSDHAESATVTRRKEAHTLSPIHLRVGPGVDAEPLAEAEAVASHEHGRIRLLTVVAAWSRAASDPRFSSPCQSASGVQNRRGRIRNGPNVAARCSHGGQKGISEAAS